MLAEKMDNKTIILELEFLKKLKLPPTQTFLAQMFLILRDHARTNKAAGEKSISELTLEDIVKLVGGEP
jgi:hypothetical protein